MAKSILPAVRTVPTKLSRSLILNLKTMCGIVGYVGNKDALPILLESLKKLEYRGYDSSGVGFLDHDAHLIVRKSKGKIHNLEELIQGQHLPFAHAGISHTRWATHGFPSDCNAHPHTDSKHTIAVVH